MGSQWVGHNWAHSHARGTLQRTQTDSQDPWVWPATLLSARTPHPNPLFSSGFVPRCEVQSWGLVRKGELKKAGHCPLLLFNSVNLWLVLLYLEGKLMVWFSFEDCYQIIWGKTAKAEFCNYQHWSVIIIIGQMYQETFAENSESSTMLSAFCRFSHCMLITVPWGCDYYTVQMRKLKASGGESTVQDHS